MGSAVGVDGSIAPDASDGTGVAVGGAAVAVGLGVGVGLGVAVGSLPQATAARTTPAANAMIIAKRELTALIAASPVEQVV